jgi:hypothetical protein
VQQDQHAVGVRKVPLVLLDAGACQRPPQFGRQRRRQELGKVELRELRHDRPQFLHVPALDGAVHVEQVQQAAAGVADGSHDLLQAAAAVALEDDAGVGSDVGAEVGVDAFRVADGRRDSIIGESSSEGPALDKELDFESRRQHPMQQSDDQLVLANCQRAHNQ